MTLSFVILAGGNGTRLAPLTNSINKHLLPVGDKPMVSHIYDLLGHVGAKSTYLVTNQKDVGMFADLIVKSNHIKTFLTTQRNSLGIADAISECKYVCDGPIFVVLGDNIFDKECQEQIKQTIDAFKVNPYGAHVWYKRVTNANEYGVLVTDPNETKKSFQKVIDVREKPENSTSDKAMVGAYLFDSDVWDFLTQIPMSDRGEYEITDVVGKYVELKYAMAHELTGSWYDMGGSIESYYHNITRINGC